ncbi:MAG: tetratricopeptide repeat protein [Planctomycetes bacterium]|nr:tetratricopeptide repeat protein [Planctomycetota bacterium]
MPCFVFPRNALRGWAAAFLALLAVRPARADFRFVRDGDSAHYSNSRTFRLPWHALGDPGPAAIARLLVFGTRDGGRTWTLFTEHALDTPGAGSGDLEVTVPNDGPYGFSILAVDTLGRQEPPPAAGEEPEQTIVVDTTPPRIRLTATGGVVAWEAEDDGSGPLYAWVEAAASEGGPWRAVGGRRSTQGRASASDLPAASRWVRVRTEDRAGNAAVSDPTGLSGERSARPVLLVPGIATSERMTLRMAADEAAWGGVEAYDLWWSRDHGGIWTATGVLLMPDRQEAQIDLDEQGWYGFLLTPRPRLSDSPSAPAMGDAPWAETRYVDERATPEPMPDPIPPSRDPPDAGDDSTASTLHRQAWGLWVRGDLPAAEQSMRRALAAGPGRADIANDLGAVLFQQRQVREAESQFREAVRLAPASADYRFNLAYVLLSQRRTAEAEEELQASALRTGPSGGADIHWYLAELALMQADTPAARWHWRQVLARSQEDTRWSQAATQRLAQYPEPPPPREGP